MSIDKLAGHVCSFHSKFLKRRFFVRGNLLISLFLNNNMVLWGAIIYCGLTRSLKNDSLKHQTAQILRSS